MTTRAAETFRTLLGERRAIRTASVSSPISAKLAASLGYEVAMLAGSVAAVEVLAAPDIVLLTATELADQVRRLARVSDMPILVDADHGYGNALNVMRTVAELEMAGAAGLTIEDTLLPAQYGAASDRALIPLEEGVGKLRAALAARSAGGVVVCARTSAAGIAGTEEAIRRVRAYEAEGPDAIFLSGIADAATLRAILDEVSLPVILGAAGPELLHQPLLEEMGVSLYLLGHAPSVAAVHAMKETYVTLKNDGRDGAMKGIAADPTMKELLDVATYAAWTRDFMGPKS